VFLPIMTLEELDNHKSGISEIARNARQASRFWTRSSARRPGRSPRGFRSSATTPTARWPPLPADRGDQRPHPGEPADRQVRQSHHRRGRVPAEARAERQVVLVSKDINMRIKAHALGLLAEDTTTTRCWRHRPSCTPACASCRRTSGRSRARRGILEKGVPRLLTLNPRAAVREVAAQRVRVPGGRQAAVRYECATLPSGRGARDRARLTHAKNKSGDRRSPTASRTSRSLLMNPRSTLSPCSARRETGKTAARARRGRCRRWRPALLGDFTTTRVTVPVGGTSASFPDRGGEDDALDGVRSRTTRDPQQDRTTRRAMGRPPRAT